MKFLMIAVGLFDLVLGVLITMEKYYPSPIAAGLVYMTAGILFIGAATRE